MKQFDRSMLQHPDWMEYLREWATDHPRGPVAKLINHIDNLEYELRRLQPKDRRRWPLFLAEKKLRK